MRETLKLASKTVADAMTPLARVRMLSSEDTIFDENTMVGGGGWLQLETMKPHRTGPRWQRCSVSARVISCQRCGIVSAVWYRVSAFGIVSARLVSCQRVWCNLTIKL